MWAVQKGLCWRKVPVPGQEVEELEVEAKWQLIAPWVELRSMEILLGPRLGVKSSLGQCACDAPFRPLGP